MPIAIRTAQTDWVGSLARGAGTVNGASGALSDLDVTWAARTVEPGGRTSPEELAAAAHSSCFAMALSLRLGENGTPPGDLQVSAAVILDTVDDKPTIVSSDLTVRASVPGLVADEFARVVDEAAALCPVSRLFAGATINVDAELAQDESLDVAGVAT